MIVPKRYKKSHEKDGEHEQKAGDIVKHAPDHRNKRTDVFGHCAKVKELDAVAHLQKELQKK